MADENDATCREERVKSERGEMKTMSSPSRQLNPPFGKSDVSAAARWDTTKETVRTKKIRLPPQKMPPQQKRWWREPQTS